LNKGDEGVGRDSVVRSAAFPEVDEEIVPGYVNILINTLERASSDE